MLGSSPRLSFEGGRISPGGMSNPVLPCVSGLQTPQHIVVQLDKADIWAAFHANTTEMIVTKPGRKLFPKLSLHFSGLDPMEYYGVQIVLSRADDKKYRYTGGAWTAMADDEEPLQTEAISSNEGFVQQGSVWLKGPNEFSNFKLTNNMEEMKRDMGLKVAHNPFAKGVRGQGTSPASDSGSSNASRKRASNSPLTQEDPIKRDYTPQDFNGSLNMPPIPAGITNHIPPPSHQQAQSAATYNFFCYPPMGPPTAGPVPPAVYANTPSPYLPYNFPTPYAPYPYMFPAQNTDPFFIHQTIQKTDRDLCELR